MPNTLPDFRARRRTTEILDSASVGERSGLGEPAEDVVGAARGRIGRGDRSVLEVAHHGRAGAGGVAHTALFEFAGQQFFEDDAELIERQAPGVQSRRFYRDSKRTAGFELAEAE